MPNLKDDANKKARNRRSFLRVGAILLAALMLMSFVVMFIRGLNM